VSYKNLFGSAPYSGQSSSIKLWCNRAELNRCTTSCHYSNCFNFFLHVCATAWMLLLVFTFCCQYLCIYFTQSCTSI